MSSEAREDRATLGMLTVCSVIYGAAYLHSGRLVLALPAIGAALLGVGIAMSHRQG